MSITPCFIVVHSLSRVQLFVTPWTATQQASRSFTIYWTCSNSCPLSLWCYLIISSSAAPFSSCPQSFPSIRVFSNESALCIWWPKKVLDLQLQHPSFQSYSGLISFRIDWLDLLAVQGTLGSLLQHHNSKASILWHWAFFVVQLVHPYMATGKTVTLTLWTFVGKVKSLLFNMLSRFVIVFFQGASVF